MGGSFLACDAEKRSSIQGERERGGRESAGAPSMSWTLDKKVASRCATFGWSNEELYVSLCSSTSLVSCGKKRLLFSNPTEPNLAYFRCSMWIHSLNWLSIMTLASVKGRDAVMMVTRATIATKLPKYVGFYEQGLDLRHVNSPWCIHPYLPNGSKGIQ